MTAINKEIWRVIPGFEGLYEVSDFGRVRSLPRTYQIEDVPRGHRHPNLRYAVTRKLPGRLLNPSIDQYGYKEVRLRKEGRYHAWKVHCLVLEAFIGPRPEGWHGCHYNGIRNDNRLSNLRWDTPKGNAADTKRHRAERLAARVSA